MSRVLRLLLVAAFIAAPVAARPPASEAPGRTWVVTDAASPAASSLTAVVDPAPLAALRVGAGRADAPVVAWTGGGMDGRPTRLRHVDPDPHRPRVVRRHRPAPRSPDGEPPH